MAKIHNKVTFKDYPQHQRWLLPPSLDEMIEVDHPVRTINTILDSLDITLLKKAYKSGGVSAYHPRMMLKVLVYGYISNIYSSRRLEEAARTNIHFLWLTARTTPDHNTINRFRSHRLKDALRHIFTQVVTLLCEEGLLSIKELYVDGTKIESAAGRYTFVWGKTIKNNKEKIKKQIDELWAYAQKIAAEEMDSPEPPEFTPIDSQKVRDTVAKIEAVLKDKEGVDKDIKAKLARGKKNWPEALERYQVQEQILGDRNSYSKTDSDATFMRMKEDHLGTGQLKPAYNVQISTNNQFIADYSIHSNPGDTVTLPGHLEQIMADYGVMPEVVTADAGYGSEQNYQLLEDLEIKGYVKHSYFDKDQSEAARNKRPFIAERLYYNSEKDCYICPMGQQMENVGSHKKVTVGGYEQTITRYRAKRCEGCPLRGACYKSKEDRREIDINHNLNRLKATVNKLLTSAEGIRYQKQRGIDAEPTLGNIKSNHHFRRFMLRGNEKVEIETGLLALAQNLRKKTSMDRRKAA